MKYDVISADCHVDLIWLPPDLFTANASAAFKDRMPYVTEGPRGPEWVTKNGASFGLDAGMGSAGRPYEPGKIHRSDLDSNNPYNTYRIAGLPAGPIANPGKASIEAVLHPAQTKALYFVADGTGGHVFAETLAEQNANVAKWFALRRQRGQM